MPEMNYDFAGWATKNDIKCSDGRTIRQNAFMHNDGEVVPLVWNHDHNSLENTLGHALLENRPEGVWAYGYFNETPNGQLGRSLVKHGDIVALSIYANKLKQNGNDVIHGDIKEVSLVMAGANKGARIESILSHGEAMEDEAVIYTGDGLTLAHAEDDKDVNAKKGDTKKMADNKDKTVQDVIDSMTEEQRQVMYALIGQAIEDTGEDQENDKKTGDKEMKHNLFDKEDNDQRQNTLSHSETQTIMGDAKKYGSLKESFLAHAEDFGIKNIDYLFPDAKTVFNRPEFIKRDTNWVNDVMNNVHKTPFSRIKSVFADITEDEARAKGYIKGNLKRNEVFTLLKRTTSPTTIYKKQKMDRDDVLDITDFDVIAWIKSEMRLMLDEEIARAILIGDGRNSASDDKIKEDCVRPIFNDHELYTVQSEVNVKTADASDVRAKEFIKQVIRSRKSYKGTGTPTLYTTEDMITECLLLTDEMGRDLYESVEKLATKLRVKKIVPVEPMENAKAKDGTSQLLAVLVNLDDYNVGADKGGAVNMFDDFDIDYNQMKYLIETRISGALIKPYSAVAYSLKVSG